MSYAQLQVIAFYCSKKPLYDVYQCIFPSLSHEHWHCSHFLALEIVLSWTSWNNAQEFLCWRECWHLLRDSCGPAHGSCNGRTELSINRKSKSAPLVLPEGRGVEGGSLTRSASGWSLLKSQWTRQAGRKERLLNFRCQQLEGEGSHLSKDQLPPWQVGVRAFVGYMQNE